jgi:hypothetical protein
MLVEQFKFFLTKKTLAEQPKPIKRQLSSFKAAQWIGILYDATSPERCEKIQAFAKQLEDTGKQVTLLGFINEKKQNIDVSFDYFCKNNLTWTGTPQGKLVENFLTKSYDLLYILHPKSTLAFEYIAALTDAALKVGPCAKYFDAYDFMLEANKQTTIEDFMVQAQQYCQLLKSTNTVKNESIKKKARKKSVAKVQ